MKQICINCTPLTGRITGIERVVYENVKRIDRIPGVEKHNIVLLYPEGTQPNLPKLYNLKTQALPAKGSKLELFSLYKYLKKNRALLVSIHGGFCFYHESIVCTHDIRTWIHKEFDPLSFRLKCNINVISSRMFAKKMVTGSKTTRKEIAKHLHISEESIAVIYHGWEHILEIEPDESIWSKIPYARKGEYYYSLSSRAPHKNFKWIEEMAKNNPSSLFIIGGKKWASDKENNETIQNLLYLGYVSDQENVALMRNCKAFLHPSKYEGFGITPLEALACGATICVSNASCLPEIFGNCAHYFDPNDYTVNLERMLAQKVDNPTILLEKYSWDKSAKQWFDLMIEYEGEKH